MTEENRSAESGGESGTATALALGGASREEADAFLRDQRRHLHEQSQQIHLDVWEKRIGIVLRLATLCVGLGLAAAMTAMAWDAAHSSGLIIEPFAVPSDMAAKGLSGQVVASQMLDKLAAMQDATISNRPPQSYENNWGGNINVEIPETGISIGELRQFLKSWLGHDTRISGEVWRTAGGIAVTAREGSAAGVTFTGPESDLEGLMQQAAEHIYSVTQPYRYANYLDRASGAADIVDRAARATPIYRRLIAGSSEVERAWAWMGLGTSESGVRQNPRASVPLFQKSIAATRDFTPAYFGLGHNEALIGRHAKALSAFEAGQRLVSRSQVPNLNPTNVIQMRWVIEAGIASEKGDFQQLLFLAKAAVDNFDSVVAASNPVKGTVLSAPAGMHDGGGVRDALQKLGIPSLDKAPGGIGARTVAWLLGDWPTLLTMEKAIPEAARQQTYENTSIALAQIALAHANTGDIDGAAALIASSPVDCDDCVIARAQIAEVQGRRSEADAWFARAAGAQPTTPFADFAWGQALLARGKPDDAVAQFTLANKKGPHFADALEGWGEALMAKNQSHLALPKFAEAEKYAPNWGRLHLKWGKALTYAGKKGEAAKHFAHAAALDLTPAEKSELAKHP